MNDNGDGIIAPPDEMIGNMWGDTEELTQTLESTYMSFEEYRTVNIARLTHMINEDKKIKKHSEEQGLLIRELQEAVQKHIANESKLNRDLEDCKNKLEQAKLTAEHESELSTAKIDSLEGTIQDKDNELRETVTVIFNKDAEIERNKSQIEVLNQELIAANANREQLEIDFKKSRHDMKTQMDKLRSNMHNLLSHQGDTAKALENQVTQLQVESDGLRDALQLSQQTKARNDMENSHLRSDLQKFKDEAKSHIEENAVLHSQVRFEIVW